MDNKLHGFKSVTRKEFFKFLKQFPVYLKPSQFKYNSTRYVVYEIYSGYGHRLDGTIIAEEITPIMGETQHYLSTMVYK